MPCQPARNAAIISLLLFALSACQNDSTGPDDAFLSGTYVLDEWSYVLWGDTLPMTDDSFMRVDFLEGGDVAGEGLVRLVETIPGGQVDTVTVLGVPLSTTEWTPLELTGSHRLTDAEGARILRFIFQNERGAGTWVENFDWVVADDRASYRFDLTTEAEIIEIVHQRR